MTDRTDLRFTVTPSSTGLARTIIEQSGRGVRSVEIRRAVAGALRSLGKNAESGESRTTSDALERLAELHDRGIISDRAFGDESPGLLEHA